MTHDTPTNARNTGFHFLQKRPKDLRFHKEKNISFISMGQTANITSHRQLLIAYCWTQATPWKGGLPADNTLRKKSMIFIAQ